MPFRWTCTLLVLLLTAPAPTAGQASRTIGAYLGGDLGFTRRDLSSIRRGRVVTRVVETDDPREVAVASVARVPASVERFMAEVDDVSRLMRGRTVTQATAVSNPARPADFEGLSLPEGDIEDLEHCRPGDCRVKLPEETIRAIAGLDWGGAIPRRDAEAHVRTLLTDLAARAQLGRNLPSYADKRDPVDMRAGFRSIVERHPYFLTHLPTLRAFVVSSQGGTGSDDVESTLLWMEERFGLKPVISLNQTTVYRPARSGAVDALVTLEQIYASHYFEASVSMVAFVHTDEEPGSWFIHIRHHRFDGTLSSGQRRLIERQIRAYVGDFVAERAARLSG